MAAEPLYRQVCALLRGEAASVRPPADEAAFNAFVDEHGVSCLVREALIAGGAYERWPAAVREFLDREARFFAFQQQLRGAELEGLLASCARDGIRPIVLKGFGLSRTLYEHPHLRPAYDIDLLIRPEQCAPMRERLAERGYHFPNAVSGDLVSHEFTAKRVDERGIEHAIDVHWKIANPQAFADLFGYEELFSRSVAIGNSGLLRTVDPVLAWVYACVHRVAHHHDSDRLIWLCDIDRLSRQFTDDQWRSAVRTASEKRVRTICLRGLSRAMGSLGTPAPPWALKDLAEADADEPGEEFLGGDHRLRAEFISNWKSLASGRQRLRYLFQLAFPPPAYMLAKYGTRRRLALPWLYLRRGVAGALKVFTDR